MIRCSRPVNVDAVSAVSMFGGKMSWAVCPDKSAEEVFIHSECSRAYESSEVGPDASLLPLESAGKTDVCRIGVRGSSCVGIQGLLLRRPSSENESRPAVVPDPH